MSSSSRPPARRGPSGAWNRLKPMPSDPLDAYGLPSKGETRLHDHKNQENYYSKIVERYMKFCASSGGGEELAQAFDSLSTKPQQLTLPIRLADSGSRSVSSSHCRPPLLHRPSETERTNDLPNILLAMRKLREGVLGSRRHDHFAQRAYIFIIHASILTRSWEAYHPALQYLLYEIHPRTPLSQPEMQEFVGYRILDLACRQYELVDALLVKSHFKHRDRRVATVVKSIIQDDWVRFWRTKRAVDGYQRTIMEFYVDRMREHALKCIGKTYMGADKNFVERNTDAKWETLVNGGVGWQLQENGNVVIRKPKAKG